MTRGLSVACFAFLPDFASGAKISRKDMPVEWKPPDSSQDLAANHFRFVGKTAEI
jgi:hypothetical protein